MRFLVGRAGLHRPEQDDWPGLEVGWALHPSWWGSGYATEAGVAALSYAFDVMGAAEVYSVILPENLRSQAVARRLGLSLVEERVLSSCPAAPHGICRIDRRAWSASPRSRGRDGTGPLL
jgi:RimJ/RimL family protein N-acetyltransferase